MTKATTIRHELQSGGAGKKLTHAIRGGFSHRHQSRGEEQRQCSNDPARSDQLVRYYGRL